MSEIKVGTVTIVLPHGVEIDERAGKLTTEEKREIPKARKGLGRACEQTAVELEKAGASFSVPGVSVDGLRAKGTLSERIDQVIEDMVVAFGVLKQANLLADADAFTDLRKVNNQVKARADFEPGLRDRFTTLTDYFSSKRKSN